LSQDKFWEQWGKGGQPGGQPNEPGKSSDPEPSNSVDDDILAAWLKALPPNEVNDPAGLSMSGSTPAPTNPADLAALWPPSAPVDPFSEIHKSPASDAPSDWDLALDLDPVPPVAQPAPPAAAPPPLPSTASRPPAPAPPGGGLGDFAIGGGLAGPTPAVNPFAPGPATPPPLPTPPGSTPAYPGVAPLPGLPAASPFGPPVPPVAPPQETLQAPLLRVELRTGRRVTEIDIRGEALIGRPDATRGIHPEIDLRLDDAVSRRHAKIFMRSDYYVLTDLNSTNGTRLNGQWVQAESEVPLKAGDEIEVGELTVIRVIEAPHSNA